MRAEWFHRSGPGWWFRASARTTPRQRSLAAWRPASFRKGGDAADFDAWPSPIQMGFRLCRRMPTFQRVTERVYFQLSVFADIDRMSPNDDKNMEMHRY